MIGEAIPGNATVSNHLDIDALKKKFLCHECIGEAFFSNEVKSKGKKRKCSYCGSSRSSYSIEKASERILEVFNVFYRVTPSEPNGYEYMMLKDKESDYDWDRRGESTVDAIGGAAQIDEEPASDIQIVLADQHCSYDHDVDGIETPFSDECYYEEVTPGDGGWRSQWNSFERSLQTEARFMSRSAAAHLDRVFRDIHNLQTRSGRRIVVDAGPGTPILSLYRARVFQSDEQLEEALCRPDKHLGPPPAKTATAGRMNAKGISVFYGASEQEAALAEVRPPVGSRVAVAQFEIITPMRLLDLQAMREAVENGSVFDPTLPDRMGRAKFLRTLGSRITQPVMPDAQDFEYLATQAIADFLATEYDPPLDGIVFPSVQAGESSLNVVLFHKSSRVEAIPVEKGTDLTARTGMQYEEGWEDDYVVTEIYPPSSDAITSSNSDWDVFPSDDRSPLGDGRVESLRVNRESIIVHHILSVKVSTESNAVRLHRWEKAPAVF